MRRLRAQRGGDPVLTTTDRVQLEPLLPDLQAIAPGAPHEHDPAAMRITKDLRQMRDPPRLGSQ
jgi:hypothetical protein